MRQSGKNRGILFAALFMVLALAVSGVCLAEGKPADGAEPYAVLLLVVSPDGSLTLPEGFTVTGELAQLLAREPEVETEAGHVHEFGDKVSLDGTADCRTEVISSETCVSCGYIRVNASRGAHRYGNYRVTTKATCAHSGEKLAVCSVCGAEDHVVIPKLAHTKVTVEGYAATCTEDGLTSGTVCSVCGTTLRAQKRIPAAHTPSVVPGYAAVDCETPGLSDGSVCSVCGTVLKEQEEITIPHDYTAWYVISDTIAGEGEVSFDDECHRRHCTVCQSQEDAEHGNWSSAKADDRNDGEVAYLYHVLTCGDCGYVRQEEHTWAYQTKDGIDGLCQPYCTVCGYTGDAVTHGDRYGWDWEDGTVTDGTLISGSPACTDDGTVVWECVCGLRFTISYGQAEQAHVNTALTDNQDGKTHTVTCTDCGYVVSTAEPHDLSYEKDITGHYQLCVCGYRTEKADHDGNPCTLCGYGHDHDWSAWKKSDDDEDLHQRTCSLCGTTETQAHQMESSADEDGHFEVCTVCGREESWGWHDWNYQGTETTCKKTCKDCGYVMTSATHNFGSWEIEYDDDDNNIGHYKTCQTCEYQTAVEAHTPGDWVCTDGSHKRDCKVCGKTVDYDGHVLTWTVDKTSATGTCQYTCTVCGYTDTSTHQARYVSGNIDSDDITINTDGTVTFTCNCGNKFTIVGECTHPSVTYSSLSDGTHSVVCNLCKETLRTESCTYEWRHNDSQHWSRCKYCGYTTNYAGHSFEEGNDCYCGAPNDGDY